ncbi:DUF3679 domain-containing protein [Peribacillus frigoritolerans]|nr:DUF3679 domain-containing protein [Peribacillus frigoritolerans]
MKGYEDPSLNSAFIINQSDQGEDGSGYPWRKSDES